MAPTHEKSSIRNPQILSIYRKKGRSEIAPVDHTRTARHDAGGPKKEKGELTQEELKRLLHYDPETGVFTWRVKPAQRVAIGTVAGCLHSRGYWRVSIQGKIRRSHRLAWLYIHGYLPVSGIDHINGVKSDNRLANLRLANLSENGQNQRRAQSDGTSGYLGVSYHKKRKKWRSQICIEGRYIHIGFFPTAEKAHDAYVTAKRELHPFGML